MEENQHTSGSKCATCSNRCGKLDVFDWMSDLPEVANASLWVEVQFKNTRKAYFNNSNKLKLNKGDVVAVEASPGHDIGTVLCVGEIALLQMKKNNVSPSQNEMKRVYRKAKPADVEKWEEAQALEHETMLEARKIAERLNLAMKIGDVEYQGDRTKAIFYYIADERVDFRELIKILADRFKVRIEMRQIGARQEAGRIGGVGPCGRELCCSSWLTNFVSVTTNAARYQEISLNPQKLAGQCGKLKCCLNYELDAYIDAQKDFPKTSISLESRDGSFYHFKTDIFKRIMWYSSSPDMPANVVELPVDRVKEIILMNKKGKRPEELYIAKAAPKKVELDFSNVIGEESITRFDENKGKSRTQNKRRKRRPPQNAKPGGSNQRSASNKKTNTNNQQKSSQSSSQNPNQRRNKGNENKKS